MSGLMTSELLATAGPREEKPAICGIGVSTPVVLPTTKAALAPAVLL